MPIKCLTYAGLVPQKLQKCQSVIVYSKYPKHFSLFSSIYPTHDVGTPKLYTTRSWWQPPSPFTSKKKKAEEQKKTVLTSS
uniref:Uncharacterized protein n=1 Tax=Rhizophora mucronata TaxID=61149 RepID=A0A2P2NNM5_RHIMU